MLFFFEFISEAAFARFSLPTARMCPETAEVAYGKKHQHCDVLETITIPYRVTDIGTNAFSECVKLKSAYIPKATTNIVNNAFSYSDVITIYGSAGSAAETYANGKFIKFVENATKASSITLDKPEVTMLRGGSLQVIDDIQPMNFTEDVVWKSSNADIVAVDQAGKLTAKGVGTTTVKLAVGEQVAVCAVTGLQPVTSVSVSERSAMLEGGDSLQLSATVYPDDANDKSIKWSSSDESVATVDQAGKVAALKKGEATITAAAQDGSERTGACRVVVTNDVVVATSVEQLESAHPYANNFKDAWVYASAGASSLDVSFDARTAVEEGGDYIRVYSGDGTLVGSWTGAELGGKTVTVPGDTVKVRLESDGALTDWGFKVTRVEAKSASASDDGVADGSDGEGGSDSGQGESGEDGDSSGGDGSSGSDGDGADEGDGDDGSHSGGDDDSATGGDSADGSPSAGGSASAGGNDGGNDSGSGSDASGGAGGRTDSGSANAPDGDSSNVGAGGSSDDASSGSTGATTGSDVPAGNDQGGNEGTEGSRGEAAQPGENAGGSGSSDSGSSNASGSGSASVPDAPGGGSGPADPNDSSGDSVSDNTGTASDTGGADDGSSAPDGGPGSASGVPQGSGSSPAQAAPAQTGLAVGQTATAGSGASLASYTATSAASVAYKELASKSVKKAVVPDAIVVNGVTYKVTAVADGAFEGSAATSIEVGANVAGISAKSFVGAKKVRTITLGKKVGKVAAGAFKSNKALRTIVVKSIKLAKKSAVRGCLKGSKVKAVKVEVGSKALNKKYVKKYRKLFTKKVVGRKVKVK